jgi:amino acid transporter
VSVKSKIHPQPFTLAFLTVLNFYSIRTVVSRFQIVASFAKIFSTLLIICVGAWFLVFKGNPSFLTLHLFPGKDENLHNIFEGSRFEAGALASAFFAGLLAFDG